MDLSIIIPVYNVETYLRDCLNSVYKIKYAKKEIIIVNDGSTDSSQDIINEFEQKFPNETKVIVQKNKGLSGARNAGLSHARGKYISFIDSDDYIDSQRYVDLLTLGIKYNLDIIIGDFKYHKKDNCYITKHMEQRKDKLSKLDVLSGLKYWEESFEKDRDAVRVEVVTNFFKRDLLNSNRILFEEKLLHEDTLFMFLVMFYAKKVKYFPISFYYYRIREGSIMRNSDRKNYIHKMYIADRLQEFKELNYVNSLCWDSMIYSLYFAALRKYRIKNYHIFNRIKNNKNLTKRTRIKKVLIPIYHLFADEIDIEDIFEIGTCKRSNRNE